MSGRHYAAEGRKSVEDTHLATARRQWEGNGISGLNEKIQSRNKALFFVKLPGHWCLYGRKRSVLRTEIYGKNKKYLGGLKR